MALTLGDGGDVYELVGLWVAVPWHRARALTPRSRVKDFRPPARGVLCPSACQTLGAEDNRHRRATPADSEADSDSYISDPANPVPYRQRPVEETYSEGSRWYTWLVEDQRFVDQRPDIFSWETKPPGGQLTVAGEIARTCSRPPPVPTATGSSNSSMSIPKNTSRDPKMGGYELMIADDVLRGRFRKSFEKARARWPPSDRPLSIDLHTNDHAFPQGSPHHGAGAEHVVPGDRPQPAKIRAEHLRSERNRFPSATQRIYRSTQYPSSVEIPVVAP